MEIYTPVLILWTVIIVIGAVILLNIRKRFKYGRAIRLISPQEFSKLFRFSLIYSLNSIWKHKRRFINLCIGFIFALGLIGTMFIWLETSPRIAIIDAMDNEAIELIIQPVNETESRMFLLNIQKWVQENEELVKTSEIIQRARALFGIEGKSEDYNWFNPPVEDPIYISTSNEIFFMNSSFLDLVKNEFTLLNGTFEVNMAPEGIANVLISQRLVNKLSDKIGMNLTVGSEFNLSLATSIPDEKNPDSNEQTLKFWYDNRSISYQLPLLRINGIFDRGVKNESLLFPEYPVETLGDGLFLPDVCVSDALLTTLESLFTPNLFIRLSPTKMADRGLFNVEDSIHGLEDRIRFQFRGIIIRENTDDLYYAVNSYLNTRVIVLFMLLPVTILSTFLILFSINAVYQTRYDEVEVLKSRGADIKQIIAVFVTEIAIVTVVSTFLGIILGFLLTFIITQNSGYLDFQGISFLAFRTFSIEALKSLANWLSVSLGCAVIFLLIGLRQVFKFIGGRVSREDQKSKLETFVSDRFLDVGGLVIGLLGFVYLIQSGILIGILGDPAFLGLFLFLALVMWFAFAGYGARMSGNLFLRLEDSFKRLFSTKVVLALKNLERRRGEVISIIMILTVTVSIGIFSGVYAQTVQTNVKQQTDYLTGSDFKILTDRTSVDFVKTLDQDETIEKSMALLPGVATLAGRLVGLVGINTSLYTEICYWDPSSTFNINDPPQNIIERLGKTPNGVIINDLIARRLNLTLEDIGSNLPIENIQFLKPTLSTDLEIVGVLRSSPGIGLLSAYDLNIGYSESFGIILLNQALMMSPTFGNISEVSAFLAKASTTDVSEIRSAVERLQELPLARKVYSTILPEQIQENFLDETGVTGILTVDFGIAIIVGVLALTFFLSFVVDERRQEYAVMRAIGSQRKHIMFLILFESSTYVIFSFFAGSLLGVVFSWLFTAISLSSVTFSEPVVPYFIDFPIPLLGGTLLVLFVAMLIGCFIPAFRASKTDIVAVLKNL
ncbi:MAG: FtsX-like permease family protein [Promethearchaeota archaeon]